MLTSQSKPGKGIEQACSWETRILYSNARAADQAQEPKDHTALVTELHNSVTDNWGGSSQHKAPSLS